MVFSCVPMHVSTHHHVLYMRETCVVTFVSADSCRKYKIALKGWRKAPAVVNTCEDNTNHFIVRACAIRRELFFFFFFFALLEASPFHPRAITSTHTLHQVGWWVGQGGRKGSQQFQDSVRDKEASGVCFQEGSFCWGCNDDVGTCQDSKRSVHVKSKSK